MKKLRFAIAVFVKTPGLSPIKTRLAKDIGKEEALEVYLKCVKTVQIKIDDLVKNCSLELEPFWAVAEADGMTQALWQGWSKIYQGDGELGDRLHRVYADLIEKFDGVLLMGADSPLFPSAEIQQGISWLATHKEGALVGPTLDGGYYVFGARNVVPKDVWTSVPYSSSKTLESFLAALPQEIEKRFLSEHWDVDTVLDLKRLEREEPDSWR